MLQVNSDFLLVLAAVFSSGWKIFTSFHIPGTNMNVAEFVFACMMVVFVVRVVPRILGFASIFEPSRDAGTAPRNVNEGNRPDDIGRW